MEITESGYYDVTIRNVVESIHRKEFLLPAIQREFVWSQEQIIRLFDSLMRGFPIGSFLFWRVEEDHVRDYDYYEFIRNYHERDRRHNPKANITGEKGVSTILDGQQRLTSLYIAFKGTYAKKIPRKQWTNNLAFPEKKLYLNLLSESKKLDLKYDFQFLTEEEADKRTSENKDEFWIEVGKILEFNDITEIYDYLREEELITEKFPSNCLTTLHKIVNDEKKITYYLETGQELDKVLNIFIRINSGGTQLSYSDLLLSIATAKWGTKDARKEVTSFVADLNSIGDMFIFNKDFVLKSCLVLSDLTNIAFKVDNFTKKNMTKIENRWPDIKKSLSIAVELVSQFGYNYQNLTSQNAIIPIAYYILMKSAPHNFLVHPQFRNDRILIKKWFTLSLIKRVFSGQPDNVLRPIRRIIQGKPSSFPIQEIIDHFRPFNKSLMFNDDEIEGLLAFKYQQKHTFAIMSLLYPSIDYTKRVHKDHIFPKAFFRKRELRERGFSDNKIKFYMENYDFVGNLQLLPGIKNEIKGSKDFEEWIDEEFPNEQDKDQYSKYNYIPRDVSLNFDNFEDVFKKREQLLFQKFKGILTF